MALPIVNFRGKIDNKDIGNYYNKLDYDIVDYKERIDKVLKILNIVTEDEVQFSNDKFWQEIWDMGICQTSLNSTNPLYSETNIALFLESCGTYILNVAPHEKDEDEELVIYTDKELFEKASKEEEKLRKNGEIVDDTLIILKKEKNYKKDTKIKVNKNDIFKYKELKDYTDYREYLSYLLNADYSRDKRDKLLNKINMKNKDCNISKGKLFFILQKNYINTKDDMTYVKISKEQPMKFKAPLKDDGCPSWEELDMFDPKQVKLLLKVHAGKDLQNDLACLCADLNNIIHKIHLNRDQRKVLRLWRYDDMTREGIAEELDMSVSNVDRILDVIVKRIIKEYADEYNDWYYLNKAKGEYKQCSRCGEVKLVSKFDKNGKRGYLNICKDCRKKKREENKREGR